MKMFTVTHYPVCMCCTTCEAFLVNYEEATLCVYGLAAIIHMTKRKGFSLSMFFF